MQPVFDALMGIVDEVIPIDEFAAERAKEIVLGNRRLSPRDALHIAVMERRGVRLVMSFDAGFDGFRGTERLKA